MVKVNTKLSGGKNLSSIKRKRYVPKEVLIAWGMILPALLFFSVFVAYPAIRTFSLSFFKWDLLTTAKPVGFSNFAKLFTDDRLKIVITNTMIFTVFSVILKLVLGFSLAYLVFKLKNKFAGVFMESAIFFPIIIPMSIISMVFVMLFNTDTGAINGFLNSIGLPKVPWLSSAKLSLFSVLLVDVWKGVGFFFIIYLVGMRNIPSSYLEAADIDGAGSFRKVFNIIIPCVSGTTLFLMINAIITSLQIFDPVYLLTRGGPGDSSNTISYYIWSEAFQNRDIGYGSVLALILFAFVMIVTAIQFVISKLWVNYD